MPGTEMLGGQHRNAAHRKNSEVMLGRRYESRYPTEKDFMDIIERNGGGF